jgi:hypothetical protein
MALSIVVFAGSAQFIAVGLFAAGTPWQIVLLTTFVVNLRHMLYSGGGRPEDEASFPGDQGRYGLSAHRRGLRGRGPAALRRGIRRFYRITISRRPFHVRELAESAASSARFSAT